MADWIAANLGALFFTWIIGAAAAACCFGLLAELKEARGEKGVGVVTATVVSCLWPLAVAAALCSYVLAHGQRLLRG